MKPEAVRQYERSLYDQAKAKVAPLPDGSRPEADIEREHAALIVIDLDHEQLRRAKDIIESLSRPDPKAPGPLLTLMGDKYAFEPDRLVRADDHIVENARAPLAFKLKESQRAGENADRVVLQARRKQKEGEHFALWYSEQLIKGRPAFDL